MSLPLAIDRRHYSGLENHLQCTLSLRRFKLIYETYCIVCACFMTPNTNQCIRMNKLSYIICFWHLLIYTSRLIHNASLKMVRQRSTDDGIFTTLNSKTDKFKTTIMHSNDVFFFFIFKFTLSTLYVSLQR